MGKGSFGIRVKILWKIDKKYVLFVILCARKKLR